MAANSLVSASTGIADESGIWLGDARIPWAEIVAVGIKTTADGPYVDDVFWMFNVRDMGTSEVSGEFVSGDTLEILQRCLPGLNSAKIVEAMGSTVQRVWRIWHHERSVARPTDEIMRARFARLIGALGGNAGAGDPVFERLRSAWGGSDRRYHNVEHLTDCLAELDAARDEIDSSVRDRMELALWYHDAVYIPRASDSEERSARLLLEDATALAIPSGVATEAARLVRATAHLSKSSGAGEPSAADEDLVIDIDFAILGQDVLRFLEFEFAVEEEYRGIPGLVYFFKRGRFLASLLGTTPVYRTERFRALYEHRARDNISALLESPRYHWYRWLRWLG
ncbi:MAG: hypothetical protein HYY84_10655 [Deltaproteobacteria bacterium]|nr:hypothetical protein [Deltaproteobacteria bacterium]